MSEIFAYGIKQQFNSNLLSIPMPKLRDDSETFLVMFQNAMKKWHKLDKCPGKKSKCEQLKKEIEELYERAKEKEKNLDPDKKNKTQRPFYYVELPKELDRRLYFRLRFARDPFS